MIEDLGESRLDAEESIPIPFDHKVLSKVIEFMKYEKEVELMPEIEKPVQSERLEDSVSQWFASFINLESIEDIYDIIAAANYMDVKNLVELGCAKVGSQMKNKSISELRKMFNIINDFTPEEERTILEGKADIWGDEDDEGDETEETIHNTNIKNLKEEVKISK